MSEAPKPEWWFYHLSRTTLEQAAAPLMQKCLDVGWRVLAVSPSVERRAALDASLWTFDEKTFLPHGQAEAPGLDPARQPILLSDTCEAANRASACILADGQWRPETLAQDRFERVFLLFGEDRREAARTAWRDVSAKDDLERSFYEQREGRWVKVA